MQRRFRAVVYDFGGVFSPSPFGAVRGYEQELGVPEGTVSELMFGRSYAHGEGAGRDEHDWHKLETGRITFQIWWDGLRARAAEQFGDGFELDLGRAFSGGGMGVYWEVVHHVRRVKARGLRTAILTNNIAEYGDHWRASVPIAECVDLVVDSSHEGVRKPDPEIYLRTARRLAVDPAACVFLDDLADNVDGARRVGMHAILVGPDVRPAIAEVEDLLDAARA